MIEKKGFRLHKGELGGGMLVFVFLVAFGVTVPESYATSDKQCLRNLESTHCRVHHPHLYEDEPTGGTGLLWEINVYTVGEENGLEDSELSSTQSVVHGYADNVAEDPSGKCKKRVNPYGRLGSIVVSWVEDTNWWENDDRYLIVECLYGDVTNHSPLGSSFHDHFAFPPHSTVPPP